MMFLLDTNIIIGVLREKSEIVTNYVNIAKRANPIFITVYTIAELYNGILNIQKEVKIESEMKILELILNSYERQGKVLSLNINQAKIFAKLKYNLKKQGTPIPIVDLLIGAIALENGFILITTDKSHFKNLEKIESKFKVQYW